MKNNCWKLYILVLVTLSLWSCKKDEVMTIAYSGKPGTLTASSATLVLTSANAADTVQTFSWAKTDYGFKAAVKYTVQIAKSGTNFAAPKEVNMGNSTQLKYSGQDFNQMAIILGISAGTKGDLDVRVKSSISDSIDAVYTNRIVISVTPYMVIINYPSLWVPGEYQGWDPATAPKLSSVNDNKIYEGYVNLTGPVLKFKYTSHPDWNHTNYGVVASTTTGNNVSGTLSATGGDFVVPVAGYYLLKSDLNANTWSATKTTWGLIGDAVPGTGWTSDQDMTYNTTTKTWIITTNLVIGVIKFRANDDWPINYGDNGANLSLEFEGANIPITVAGNYTITMDLSVPGNYNYKVVKN